MDVIYVDHPLFMKILKTLIRILNFFHFYMPIDIAYFLYIFDDNGADFLYL